MNSWVNSENFWSTGLQMSLHSLCKAARFIRSQSITFCCVLTTFTQLSLEHFKAISEVGHLTVTCLHAGMRCECLLPICVFCGLLWKEILLQVGKSHYESQQDWKGYPRGSLAPWCRTQLSKPIYSLSQDKRVFTTKGKTCMNVVTCACQCMCVWRFIHILFFAHF